VTWIGEGTGVCGAGFILGSMIDRSNCRKETLGRPRCRWEDNIRMDLKEMGINMDFNEVHLHEAT
jgi:hypothetical protein